MKKYLKYYVTSWVMLFLVYNAVSLLLEFNIGGEEKFDVKFLTGYIFVIMSFTIHLITSIFLLNVDTKKVIYNIPVIKTTMFCFVIMFLFGIAATIFPIIPTWAVISFCLVLLLINIVLLMKGSTISEIATEKEEKIENSISQFKKIRQEINLILANNKKEELKKPLKELNELITYSDPVTNNKVNDIEQEIILQIRLFQELTDKTELNELLNKLEEIKSLIDKRNKIIKDNK